MVYSRLMAELASLEAEDVANHPNALGALFRGDQLGLVIRHAFAPQAMARVVERLERGECELQRHTNRYFKGVSYGAIVVIAGADLTQYLTEGVQFADASRKLFDGAGEYEARIEQLLGGLASGLPVTRPRWSDGRPYMASSIRGVAPGGTIDLHCENETIGNPGMRHLSSLIDTTDQLSFYLTLAAPQAGGEIWISSVRHDEGAGRMLRDMDRNSEATLQAVGQYDSVTPHLEAGDLLVFDAGRHFHRVTQVEGTKTRWTMGGFLAQSKAHDCVYYWS